jgi:hypothetical protein
LLPEQVELTLTLATEDWRPLELLIYSTLDREPQEILVRWERAESAVIIPEGYTPLVDYIQPAADPGRLLTAAAGWLKQEPVRVDYPEGSALLDGSQARAVSSGTSPSVSTVWSEPSGLQETSTSG